MNRSQIQKMFCRRQTSKKIISFFVIFSLFFLQIFQPGYAFNNNSPANQATPTEIEEPLVAECELTKTCGGGGGPPIPIPSTCGNGIREATEQCDPRNQMDELGQCSADHSMYCNNSCQCETLKEDVVDKLPSAQVAGVVNQFQTEHPEVTVENQGNFFVVRYPAQSAISLRAALKNELDQIPNCADGRCQMVDAILPFALVPNDPKVSEQWNLCRVNAPGGWNMSLGEDSVTIAHIDTGVNFSHEDLQGLLSSGRIAGGYTRCSAPDCTLQEGAFDSYYYHGTHTFGVMAASWNNNLGIAGIVPENVKFYLANISGRYDPSLPGTENDRAAQTKLSYVLQAIDKSTQSGAQIVLAGIGISGAMTDTQLQALIDPNRLRNALLVLPAGNNGLLRDKPLFFNHPQVLIVGATDESDLKTSSSNYGNNWIHLGAPGIHVPVTKDLIYDSDPDLYPQNAGLYGTSISAAHAAGTLGLMFSINPALTAQNAKVLLLSGVDLYPATQTFALGAGRLNMKRALCKTEANNPVAECYSLTVNVNGSPNPVNLGGSVSFSCSVDEANSPCNAASFSYSWNFGDTSTSSTQNPSYSYQAPGNFTAMCTASEQDNPQISGSNSTQIEVLAPVNQAPVVNAGDDQNIMLPADSVSLDGTVTDPDGPSLITLWTQQSGPGIVTFEDASSIDTIADFSLAGTYILRLTANDGVADPVFDEVQIEVEVNTSGNQAPFIYAGPDQTIALPANAYLMETKSDDGLPNGILLSSWSKQSGPGNVTFELMPNTYPGTTKATFSENGVYILRATATDLELSSYDELIVTVGTSQSGPACYAGVTTKLIEQSVHGEPNVRSPGDRFGHSMSIDGNQMAISAPGQHYDANGANFIAQAGAVFVYENGILKQKVVAPDRMLNPFDQSNPCWQWMNTDRFGHSVSISGNTMVVGAPWHDYGVNGEPSVCDKPDRGAIYIFKKISGVWTFQQKFVGAQPVPSTMYGNPPLFGYSVAVSGDTIVAGELGIQQHTNDTWYGSGAISIFKETSGVWSLQRKIKGTELVSNPLSTIGFGYSVGISGNTIAAGAPGFNNVSGVGVGPYAFVFVRSGSVWSLQQTLSPGPDTPGTSHPAYSSQFGFSVSISGDKIAVGAPADNSYAGRSFVFKRTGTAWSLEQTFSGTGYDNNFGRSVSIAQNFISIGSKTSEHCVAPNSNGYGAMHIYQYSGTSPGSPWNLTAVVAGNLSNRTLQNGVPLSEIATSVGISGSGAFALGAPGDNASMPGINPSGAGAAWMGQISASSGSSGTGGTGNTGGPKKGAGPIMIFTPAPS